MNSGKSSIFPSRGISVRQAACCKNVSQHTIYNWIRDGKISARKVSGRYWIKEDKKFEEAQRYRRLSPQATVNQNRRLRSENRRLQRDLFSQQHQVATSQLQNERLQQENNDLREKFQTSYHKLYQEYQALHEKFANNSQHSHQENTQMWSSLQQQRSFNQTLQQDLRQQKQFQNELLKELEVSKNLYRKLHHEHQQALSQIENLKEELAKWQGSNILDPQEEVVVEIRPKYRQIASTSVIDSLSHWEVKEE